MSEEELHTMPEWLRQEWNSDPSVLLEGYRHLCELFLDYAVWLRRGEDPDKFPYGTHEGAMELANADFHAYFEFHARKSVQEEWNGYPEAHYQVYERIISGPNE